MTSRFFVLGAFTTTAFVVACGSTVVVFTGDDEGQGGTGAGTPAVTSQGPGQGPSTTVGPGPGPGPGPGQGPGPGVSTVVGPRGGICGSGLTTGTDGEDACLTASCCSQFNACIDDMECSDCLVGGGGGACDNNTLLRAFDECSDTNCTVDICGVGITFSGGNGDPAFACNACATDNCCPPLQECVGGGSQTEITNCIECLADPMSNACLAQSMTVQDGALRFMSCIDDSCPNECGDL